MLHVKSTVVKPLLLLVSFLTIFSFAGKAGQDFYEIYLNKKLVGKKFVGELSSALMSLPLEDAKESDEIRIYYYHCHVQGGAAKGRTIVVRDEQNKNVKEWKFADAAGRDGAMTIPVKDILDLKKKYGNSSLYLYYSSSDQLPKGMTLASINQVNKKVTQLKNPLPVFTAGLFGLILQFSGELI